MIETIQRESAISFPMLGNFTINPPSYFTVFGKNIYFYGVIIGLGFIIGILYCSKKCRRFGITEDDLYDVMIWLIPCSVLGARLYYVAFRLGYYLEHMSEFFAVWNGGLAIYGGIIGGVITGYLWTRAKRVSFLKMADLAAPALAFGQAVGRWGNFLNSEAYGSAITNPAWQFFPAAVFIERENGWFAATFFYESFWCFLICALILALEKRSPAFSRPGRAALFYAILYAFERAIVESLRTDSLYLGSVRVSQMLSALVLTVCAAFLILRMKKSAARRIYAYAGAVFACALLLSAITPDLTGFIGLLVSDAGLAAVCLTAFFKDEKAGAKG